MLRFLTALAAASIMPAQAAGPTREEALRCYFITHPNQAPLQLEHFPPTLNPGRSHFL